MNFVEPLLPPLHSRSSLLEVQVHRGRLDLQEVRDQPDLQVRQVLLVHRGRQVQLPQLQVRQDLRVQQVLLDLGSMLMVMQLAQLMLGSMVVMVSVTILD